MSFRPASFLFLTVTFLAGILLLPLSASAQSGAYLAVDVDDMARVGGSWYFEYDADGTVVDVLSGPYVSSGACSAASGAAVADTAVVDNIDVPCYQFKGWQYSTMGASGPQPSPIYQTYSQCTTALGTNPTVQPCAQSATLIPGGGTPNPAQQLWVYTYRPTATGQPTSGPTRGTEASCLAAQTAMPAPVVIITACYNIGGSVPGPSGIVTPGAGGPTGGGATGVGSGMGATRIDYRPLVNLPFVGDGVQTIEGYLLAMFRLLISLAGVVAVVRMVICGFQAVMSVNPAARGEASQCVVGALTGLLLALSAWVILYQINPTLLSTNFNPPATTSVAGASGPGGGQPAGQCDTAGLCQGTSPGGTVCSFANTNCAAYSAYADRYAGGGISANMLREVMAQESSCNISLASSFACGLMQLKPDTAQLFRGSCGVSEQITCDWLRTPANAEASVCIAAAYLRSLYSGSCTNSIRQTLAGYNGGAGACAVMSQDCTGETNCDGGTMRQWECPYEDPAHTICNTGTDSFQQTRNYVREILFCLQPTP